MDVQVVDYTATDAPQKFVESLRETGFAVLTNHPLSQDLVQSIYDNWLNFFNSPAKQDFLFDPEKQDGYFPPEVSEVAKGHEKKDIKEYYHIYPWGRIPADLESEITGYYEKASTLAGELLAWVEKNAPSEVAEGFSEPLPHMIEDTPNTLLRVLHYPPFTGEEEPGAIRAAAHEDINLLTILPAASEPGLQVKQKDDTWVDVPSKFGYLIINTGDMLQEASGGYFPSTSHRVINPAGGKSEKSRMSLPLFLHPRSEVVLSERHTQRSYLMERLKELGVV
ncbi:2OG-Fe(II) oxygenase family protein [Endozoicomonas numazuensis]|uniref:2-oxoglutarate-dependent ethylene/succinate-forming enzyme n=1 Tax=Endozoicomonas numazuensis TaxID=1137799 RepID=A0A081NKX0_9GAMM|nr:2OG-Fe(II) oxygenase family protein [Endozoicomonas numazuensis]KEQ19093.1 2OG-Fe(II) oxygenase [Endozoicomonas numazuensis]